MADGILADLTLRLRASTVELQEGLKKASGSVSRFSKESKEKSKKIKEGFGNIKQGFSNMASSITDQVGGLTGQFGSLATGIMPVIQGIKGMTVGMNLFKVALASTGIGLVLVALASLVVYFTKTQRGADMVSVAMASVGAIFTTLIDTLSGFGETLVSIWNDPMKAIKGFGDSIKNFVLSKIEKLMKGISGMGTAFKLLFEGEFKKAAATAGNALVDITTATNPVAWALEGVGAVLDKVVEKYGEASEKAKQAAQLQRDSNQLEKDKLKLKTRSAELELKMSELIRKSKEKENFTEEQRLEFVRQAQTIQKQLSAEKISQAKEELRIKEGLDALGENMLADDQATADLKVQVLKLQKEENDKVRELVNRENEALNALKARTAEQEKINAAKQAEVQHQKKITDLIVNTEVKGKAAEMPKVAVEFEVKPVDPAQLSAVQQSIVDNFTAAQERMKAVAQEVSGMIQATLTSAISGFADAFGKALAGDMGGIQGFFQSLLGLVIDFGAQFGKLLISIGLAKVSLEAIGISGIGAVIAGTALVALTSAASSLLSKGMGGGSGGGKLPAFANGGTMKESGWGVTGERGIELQYMPKGTQTVRANKTEQLFKNMGSNVSVSGNIRITGEELDIVLTEHNKRKNNNF